MEDRARYRDGQPALSVIIPVRNEEQHIADILFQLENQTLDPSKYEILVVDGCSEDRTREIVQALQQKYTNIRLLINRRYLSGAARNLGVRSAKGEYVLFVDGHCRINSREMLERVLAAFRSGIQAVSRPQPQVTKGVTPFQKAVSLARHSLIGHNLGSAIYSSRQGQCNPMSAGCGYTRKLFLQLGGVDETFDAAEDVEFNLRVHKQGIKAFHSEFFSVGYFPRKTFLALFRQLFRYGYGRARLSLKYPEYCSYCGAILSVFSLMVILMPLLSPIWPLLLPGWALLVLGYGTITAVAAALQSRGKGLTMWLLVWSCFPAIHFGSGLGFLSGLLGGFAWNHAPPAGRSSRSPGSKSFDQEIPVNRTAQFREPAWLNHHPGDGA